MKKVKQVVKKELVIIARVQWKAENKVCYLVRSSKALKPGTYTQTDERGVVEFDGQDYLTATYGDDLYLVYQTCFKDGRLVGCTCPARVECLHKKELAVIEASRQIATPVVPVAHIVETVATTTEASSDVDAELEALLKEVEAQDIAYAGAAKLPRAAAVVTGNLTCGQGRRRVGPTDLSTKGVLNGNKGFAFMR